MVICFTSYRSLGCTFLDWSFNWLAGHKEYWFDGKNQWDKLVENPLTRSNDGNPALEPYESAHLHKKNHPIGMEQWVEMTQRLCDRAVGGQPLTYYGSTIDIENENNFFDCISTVLGLGAVVIFLRCNETRPKSCRRMDPGMTEPRYIRDAAIKEKILLKFKNTRNLEDKIKPIAKMREFLSLTVKNFTDEPDKDINHAFFNLLSLDYKSFILDGERTMRELFKFLNKEINEQRYSSWVKIYEKWRESSFAEVLFYEKLPEILDCIRSGVSHSLEPYRLDTLKEAVIQNALMKRYNDRLLVGTMAEFPDNTLKLTSFLKSRGLS
jgi:hypothetical protein